MRRQTAEHELRSRMRGPPAAADRPLSPTPFPQADRGSGGGKHQISCRRRPTVVAPKSKPESRGDVSPSRGLRLHPMEHEPPGLSADDDGVARLELAGQDALRQRVFQLVLDRTLERAGAVDRVEAGVAEQVEDRLVPVPECLPECRAPGGCFNPMPHRIGAAAARRVRPPPGSQAACAFTPWNTSRPDSVPTTMVSPGLNSPARIRCASGFSSWCWIARLSGRAP
jgi:hypothetical protein